MNSTLRHSYRYNNGIQHQVDRLGSFEMPALEFAYIDSLAEPSFRGGSGQSRMFREPSRRHRRQEKRVPRHLHSPCCVETWSCRDQYGHFFALNHGEGLSFAHLARFYRFRRRTGSSPATWVVKQVPELGSDAVLFRFARFLAAGSLRSRMVWFVSITTTMPGIRS